MKYINFQIDLGNVLIDLKIDVFHREVEKRLRRKVDLGNDSLHHEYMAGKFDEDTMRSKIASEYGLTIDKEEFPEFWSIMLGSDREELYPLLDQLRKKKKLALCSNTDATHIRYLEQKGCRMIANFDHYCYSFNLGFIKPEPEYFKACLDIIKVSPENCLFLDDGLSNVEGARQSGIQAIHTPTKESVIHTLKTFL